ncbi:hypothetical protein GCM10010423_69420 [Streptomyces levis]|uniref:Uncharacterized protein n=1 Tax=Streptomyces levis TaxID=285566 RepID=A0ABN3P286_9ACTN
MALVERRARAGGGGVLFAGTLVFAVDLLDSFLQGLSVQQINRLVWAPDMIGCVLFLISGHLAFAEICHRGRPCLRRSLGRWIVAVNQLGSALYFTARTRSFSSSASHPASRSPISPPNTPASAGRT